MAGKEPHKFRQFFTLVKNPNNATNALAVCNWCIRKYGSLRTAQSKPECTTANRAKLCRSHLSKCSNFKEYATSDEVQRVLNLSVPEDNKKKNKGKRKEGEFY